MPSPLSYLITRLPLLDLVVLLLPLIVEDLQPELVVDDFHQETCWDDFLDDDAGCPGTVDDVYGLSEDGYVKFLSDIIVIMGLSLSLRTCRSSSMLI